MITMQDKVKLASKCGIDVGIRYKPNSTVGNGTVVYTGTLRKLREFDRLLGVLEEQFENEADIIRENKKDD